VTEKEKIQNTNFDGEWSELCPFCKKPQHEHRVDSGRIGQIRYFHRMPCEPEQYEIRKKVLNKANTLRIIIVVYDILKYLWGLIPFKGLIYLACKSIKQIFIIIRSWDRLRKYKPKK
jgi:hypothetical protein